MDFGTLAIDWLVLMLLTLIMIYSWCCAVSLQLQ